MWGFHCSVNERSWKCWQMQMGAREILHSEIQRFYERNSKIENHFKTKNVKPTKHNHAKLKSIVFFSPKLCLFSLGKIGLQSFHVAACDWLTLKYLWPKVVETDAMSQIDIDNTCYVGDRSCNDGSQREGGSSQLSRLISSSSELAAGRKKKKRICWWAMSF